MVNSRWKILAIGHAALALLAVPAAALAQTPTTPLPGTPAAPPADGSAAGLIGLVATLIAFIIAIGIAVKIYDTKRKREDQGFALQARLSDALLLHPSLAGMPVVASVNMPLWRSAPPVVELKGTVLTPDAREMAVHVVERELAGSNARLEDQIVVDPQGVKHLAA